MRNVDQIIYTAHHEGYSVIIEGINLPHLFYDPLSKLWATLRKEIRKKYRVDVAGTFVYDDVKCVISCNFYLNYSIIEFTNTTEEEYRNMFKASFQHIVDALIAIISIFVDDDAYGEYLELTKAAQGGKLVSHGEFDRIFNLFLKDLGIRQM
ncbi:hypothetical protein IJF93_00740 [Candidatus Saccharibacteria bacterium]|nr:hypothetical protein [Candidatus Saccharibacteria bacterium]